MSCGSRLRGFLTSRIPLLPPPRVRVVVAIVLGLATTIAVAWALAYFVDGGQTKTPYWQRGFKTEGATLVIPTPANATESTGRYMAQVTRVGRWGTDIVELAEVWDQRNGPAYGSPHALLEGTSFATEMKAKLNRREAPIAWWRADGWPLLALSAEARWWSYDALGLKNYGGGVLVGSRHVPPGEAVRMLPLQPIWSGLVIDSLLFACLWFALLSFGDIRRAILRWTDRSGRCVKCGYILLPEQARCSECGADARSISAESG